MAFTGNRPTGSGGHGGATVPAAPAVRRPTSFLGVSRWTLARYGFCYLVLAIPSLLFLVFRIIPMAQTFQLSVLNWDLISPVKPYVGLENFRSLLDDPNFQLAFSNTTLFAAVTVTASTVLALIVALPLTRRTRLEGIYQLIYFLPYVAPVVPVTVAWKWIFDTRYGIVNYLLSLVNVGPVPWLTQPDAVLWAVIIMSVWKMLGYNIVLFIVGLRAIPAEYSEAGQIDGASGRQLFRFVTLPLLMPVVLLVTVFSTISAYNVFTQIYVFASDVQGSPGSLARVLIYDIFENAFRFYRMGYASAEASVFFVLVLLLTLLEFRVLRSRTEL
jgi:multiple sugar transport system permease protein